MFRSLGSHDVASGRRSSEACNSDRGLKLIGLNAFDLVVAVLLDAFFTLCVIRMIARTFSSAVEDVRLKRPLSDECLALNLYFSF